MSDFIVIGAGAVGCLTALELTRRGAKVMLVERGELGSEASWAGGGILFPLLPWRYGEAVNRLALAGMAAYPALAAELHASTGIDPEYTTCGMRILPDFGGENALNWCASHGLTATLEDESLWLPQVAQARNPRLLKALRHWLENHGVSLREHTESTSFAVMQNHISGLQTASGEILQADRYIVTAGAWSRPLLGQLAPAVDLRPMRGQMLLYRLPVGTLPYILYQNDFYLIQRLDGHLLAGSTVEDVGFDKGTTETAARDLHRKAAALLPELGSQQPLRHWSGLRPGSPDNLPIIGRHPRLENLWLNIGHFRYGVTMAPASAAMLADLIDGATPALDATPYAFPG